MSPKDKERLVSGALCLLAVALAVAGGNGRLGRYEQYSWMFLGLTTGWFIKSFLPEPEKVDWMTYGIRLAVSLIGALVFIALVGFIGGLFATHSGSSPG